MGNLEHPGGGPTPRLERLDDDHDNDASMMELIPPAIKGKINALKNRTCSCQIPAVFSMFLMSRKTNVSLK